MLAKINYVWGSLELLIVSLRLVSVVFVLNPGTEDGHHNDSSQVGVEPGAEGTVDVLVHLLGEGELVGPATGVERDAAEDHVAACEGCSDFENVLEEEDGSDSSCNSTANIDAPEKNLALSKEQHSLVKEHSTKETAPASDQCSAESLELHHEEANNEADQNGADKDSPANPGLSGILEEGGVEEQQDGEDSQRGSNDKDRCLEEPAAKEAEENTDTNEEGSPDPSVFLNELPESIQVEGGADVSRSERGFEVVAGAIDVDQFSCRVLLSVAVADETNEKAEVVRLVLELETESGATIIIKIELLGLD